MKKQLIALLTAMTVALQCFAAFAADTAAEETAVTSPVLTSFEYSSLAAMGFVCDDALDAREEDLISRADFVGMLFALAGFDVHNAASPFIDINSSTPHRDEICTMYEMGIISGSSDRTFAPDDGITYSQAAKLCLMSLGYGEYVKARYGDDINSYVLAARLLKLNSGVNINDGAMKAKDVFTMLYNTARTYVPEEKSIDSLGNVTYGREGQELIEKVHNMYYDEGVMRSDGIVNLNGDGASSGTVVIGSRNFKPNGSDYSELLGTNVRYIYRSGGGTDELVYAQQNVDSKVITIQAHDLMTGDSRYGAERIIYDENGKIRTASVDKYADFVYNHQLVADITLNNYRVLKPEVGYIRLTDSDGDGTYDTIIVTEYENIFVTATADSGRYIGDKYGNSIDLDEYESVFVYISGERKLPSDISVNRVVSVVKSDDKKNIFLYACGDGTSAALETDSNDGERKLGFGGIEYELSPTYTKLMTDGGYTLPEIVIGGIYKYYLDIEGNIAHLERTDGVTQYAYLFNAAYDSDPMAPSDRALLRLLLSTDDKVTVHTGKKLIIDGADDKTGIDLMSDSRLIGSDGKVIEQVVKVRISAANELKEITFAAECDSPYGYDTKKFTKNVDGKIQKSKYYGGGHKNFDLKYFVTSNTVCFVKYTNEDSREPYHVVSATSFTDKSTYAVDIYDINERLEIGVITVSKYRGGVDNSSIMLVTSSKRVLGENGDSLRSVTGIYGGATVTYTEDKEGVLPNDLKRGDMICIGLYDGYISSYKMLYRLSEAYPEPAAKNALGEEDTICGKIYSVGENNVVILTPEDRISDVGKLMTLSFADTYSTVLNIQVYDARTETAYVGKMRDFAAMVSPKTDGEPDGDENCYLIANCYDGYIKNAFIIYY